MSKIPSKQVVRRSKSRKTVTSSPPSLPPGVLGVDAATSVTPPDAEIVPAVVKKPFWDVSKDSKCYGTTMKILAMRVAGIDDKTIAETLKLSMQTIWNYCYIAGKNNWADTFANAKDQIEFAIMPKVVRELEAGLDDQTRHVTSGMPVAKQMALAIAAGTVFKKFDQAVGSDRPISNVIAIRIEHAPGAAVEVREENIGGIPAYQDGEVTDVFPEG